LNVILFSAKFIIKPLLLQTCLHLVFNAYDNGKLQKCYVELTKYMFIRHLQLCNAFFKLV